MTNDYRHDAARYYDKYCAPPPGDVAFYRARIPKPNARVLELGCGTGRVLVPLIEHCSYVHGLDLSPGMLEICQAKLDAANVPADRASVELADITDFDLTGRMAKFDLITAPFRVMQNVETDEQVAGLMRCIVRHLAPGGRAVLNTFRPRTDPAGVKALWDSRTGKEPTRTISESDGRVELFEHCTRYADNPLRVYPILSYRRFDAQGNQVDEAALDIVMRVWYGDELLDLIGSNGFEVIEKWGDYEGEPWGEGTEQVVVFEMR